MELIEIFWCMFGLIMGFVCCHLAYKGTEEENNVGNIRRPDQRELERDTDMRIYVPERDRPRSIDHGRVKQLGAEEKAIVLNVILHDYSRTLSAHEKEALEAIKAELEEKIEPEEVVSAEGAMQGLDRAVERLNDLTARRMAR